MYRCFPTPTAACLNWETFEGNRLLAKGSRSTANCRDHRKKGSYGDGDTHRSNEKFAASFQAETETEGMDFPCHDKADIGQAGFQTCHYTQKKEKAIQ